MHPPYEICPSVSILKCLDIKLNFCRKESVSTQVSSFRQIIILITHYPRIRLFFLRFQDFEDIADCEDAILARWKREQDPRSQQWHFFSKLAAASIVKGEIAALIETIPPDKLAVIDENGGVIDYLLRALSCQYVRIDRIYFYAHSMYTVAFMRPLVLSQSDILERYLNCPAFGDYPNLSPTNI
jgi:hypothetical protein